MIRVLATKSHLPLSVGIRVVLNEPCSHIVLVFDDSLCIHSNLVGVNLDWYKSVTEKTTVVKEIIYDKLTLEQEEEIFRSIMDNYDGNGYDLGAFAYFFVRAMGNRLFNIPYPKYNRWQSKSSDLCTEMVSYLPEWLTGIKKGTDLSIVSPWKLINILEEKHNEINQR